MSFSTDVKNELAALFPDKSCCLAAQAYGMLEFGHAFSGSGISLQTENEHIAKAYSQLIARICHVPEPQWQALSRKNGFHIVTVPDAGDRARVLERFGHTSKDVTVRLNRANIDCDTCPSAFLRGAFLTCGTVTNPNADYHMEFSVPYYTLSRDFLTLLRELCFNAKLVRRKGNNVVYFKESEQIEDCLTLMGAQNATLELMNIKMVKDIRNMANRIANCETANIDKTVAAASIHVEAVKKIEERCGLNALPDDLRELAQVRLDNPELSLRELSEVLSEPLSRSGINHRLKRIIEFADKL
jgi:DNA-binding protein WhiA